jgi:hypothetical protein
VIQGHVVGAVLVLEKPSNAADDEDYLDSDDDLFSLNDGIDDFQPIKSRKPQEMAEKSRHGTLMDINMEMEELEIEIAEPNTTEVQKNEIIEEVELIPGSIELDLEIDRRVVPKKHLKPLARDLEHENVSVLSETSERPDSTSNGNPKKNNFFSKTQKTGSETRRPSKNSSSEKCWECDKCGKKYGYKHHLIRHFQTHNATKDFKCGICEKAFRTEYSRYSHENRHDAPKVRCKICNKKYKNRDTLKSHKSRVHSNSKLEKFQCQVCNKILSRKYSLRRHEKKIHKLN